MSHYLIIATEFPPGPGGIGKHAYGVAKGLAANGCKVSVIADLNYAAEAEIEKFIEDHRGIFDLQRVTNSGVSRYTNRIIKAIRAVKSNNYRKVIVTGKFPIWLGGLLKVIFGKKVIVECFVHGSEAQLPSAMQRRIFNRSLRLSDRVWCVSKYTQAIFANEKKIHAKTSVLPNGLNMEDWPQGSVQNNPLNWTGYPKLLTVGNISPRKGQHCVIKALPEIIKSYPDVHYHIVGLDKNADAIKKLAIELDVAQHITIHGRLSADQLVKAYQSADIFCMLSENQPGGDVEGFGIAILEANVMGLPAIGSRGCGIEDAIENGFNGYTVESHDSRAFAASIDLILLNSDRDEMSRNCVAWAHKHDWNELVKRTL